MTGMNWKDLARSAEEGTKLLPNGTYTALVVKSAATEASTGAKMIKLTLQVEASGIKRNLWTNLVVSEDNPFALKRLFGTLGAFGITKDWLDLEPSLEMVAAALMDRRVQVVVDKSKYQDQDRNEVTGYIAVADAIQPSLPDPAYVAVGAATGDSSPGGDIAF